MFRPQAIGHVARGVNYAIGNSFRGLRYMALILRKKNADRDLQMTSDGVTVVTHWPRPLAHGFIDPEHKIPHLALIEDHTWAEWSRCYTAGGYRMHTLDADLKLCGELGVTPWLEPKHDRRFRNQAFWDGVMVLAKRHGVRKVRGYTLRENADCLPFMRKAGIPATKLRK
jgi:hypothetical protein